VHEILDSFVVRIPVLSCDYFLEPTNQSSVSDEKLTEEFRKLFIKEAIYLASPVLFRELEESSKIGL